VDGLLRLVQRKDWVYKWLIFVAALLLPAVEIFLVATLPAGLAAVPLSSAIALGAIVVVHAVLAFLLLLGPATPASAGVALLELEDEVREREAEAEALRRQRDTFFVASGCAASSLEALRAIVDALPERVYSMQRLGHLREILQPFIVNRDRVLGFASGEGLFNIAVYLHDPVEGTLVQAFRSHDDRLRIRNREWRAGEGHVGLSFARGDALSVLPDLGASPGFFLLEDDLDRRQYGSLASALLQDLEGKAGVLVLSSSKPGQFTYEQHGPIVELMARIVSIYLANAPYEPDSPHRA
jgi:hypothetical protein